MDNKRVARSSGSLVIVSLTPGDSRAKKVAGPFTDISEANRILRSMKGFNNPNLFKVVQEEDSDADYSKHVVNFNGTTKFRKAEERLGMDNKRVAQALVKVATKLMANSSLSGLSVFVDDISEIDEVVQTFTRLGLDSYNRPQQSRTEFGYQIMFLSKGTLSENEAVKIISACRDLKYRLNIEMRTI